MTTDALRIEHLSLAIGSAAILTDVSFGVGAGAFVSVIGPNGAGKSTLLRCVNRIIGGTRGRIEIFGQPLEAYSQRELAKRVSYVPQADGRHAPFTVDEFVLLGRYPYLRPFAAPNDADSPWSRSRTSPASRTHSFGESFDVNAHAPPTGS